MLVCGYGVKGLSVVQGTVTCQQHWHQVHAIRCGRCVNQLSERAHASSSCLNINHNPHRTNKHVVVEPCKRWRRCPAGLLGKREMSWARASPYFEVQEPLQTCTPCFHTSRTSLPHPQLCYERSMVCALMACYLLESSECQSSGQIFIRAWTCSR
jgi:hypothetical protein